MYSIILSKYVGHSNSYIGMIDRNDFYIAYAIILFSFLLTTFSYNHLYKNQLRFPERLQTIY